MSQPQIHVAGMSSDFAEGQIVGRLLEGKELIFIRRSGSVLAFDGLCTHQPIKLSEFGEILGGKLICHAHGGVFDLDRGGEVLREPPCDRLRSFRCEESFGQVHVFID